MTSAPVDWVDNFSDHNKLVSKLGLTGDNLESNIVDEKILTHSDESSPEALASGKMLFERRRLWRAPALLTLALILAVFAIYWKTSWSIVSIWIRSETYTHGFLILPISAYLVWKRRDELLWVNPEPNWLGIPIILVLGIGWLASHLASVLVIEQLAMMAMVPTVILTLLGWRVTRLIIFPIFFLFFAVPMGEDLVPPLMDYTANFTVSALKLTGIPVFHEGTFFEIPGSHWSVIEACSGIRYLIASLTLGCLYAYLSYQRLSRRLLFIAASVVVPILANGVRAYIIVMIAYLSDLRLATGVDHIIYGWIFFGLVMVLLFWVGSFWHEDPLESKPLNQVWIDRSKPAPGSSSHMTFLTMGGMALVLVTIWPIVGGYLADKDTNIEPVVLTVPPDQKGWKAVAQPSNMWQPSYSGTDALINQTYQHNMHNVNVYVAYYRRQRQGAELVNAENVLVSPKNKVWHQTADSPYEVTLNGKRFEVRLAKIRSDNQDLLVWYWFWVNGHTTTNHYLTKLWDAKAKLLGETGDAAAIMISTSDSDGVEQAKSILKEFMSAMNPAITASLENAASD